jgi:DNA-binding PadR family transcriptional regulator
MMVISILHVSPKNGVEIMDGIESMTRGWWRPSPGSVYPLLDQLEDDRLVKKRPDGRYELTAKASEDLEISLGPRFRRPRTLEDMMNEMHGFVSHFEDLGATGKENLKPHQAKIRSLAKRLAALAGEDEPGTASKS